MLQRMLRADRGEPLDLSRLIGEAWPLLLVGVAYVILGLAGLELASLNPSVTPVWPPTGLAIAAVLLCGQRVVPVIFAAAFVVNQLNTAFGVDIRYYCLGEHTRSSSSRLSHRVLGRGRAGLREPHQCS